MNTYTFRNENGVLNVLFYSSEIVRFFYGKEIKKNITDAVILEPVEVVTEQKGSIIIAEKFTIEINDDLTVKITDKDNFVIIEDEVIKSDVVERKNKKVEGFDDFKGDIKEKGYKIWAEKKLLWEKGFYGLGEKYAPINKLDTYTENWNTDIIAHTTVHNSVQKAYHTSIPFYIGMNEEKAYGIMYDNSYRNYFDFARFSENVVFKADGGELDYYFIYGENAGKVLENYSKLTGGMPLPRKDFLGYQQCRWSYMDTKEVLHVAEKLREYKIPADVIYLDIDYMQDYKVFTTDSERFKDFKDMTDRLHEMGFKLVVIIDPGIKIEKGYDVYDEGLANEYYVRDKNGFPAVGKVWPGDCIFPDFLRKEVRDWWGELHKKLTDIGVDGIWNDMNEVAVMDSKNKTLPEDSYQIDESGEIHYQKEVHNLYGHYEAKSTYAGLTGIKNERPFILTRSASAGTQRYSALWTGDNSSVWEHLEASIANIMNLGMSGYTYVGADVGGFLEDGNGELFARWMQLGMFYPLFRNHSVLNSIRQEPWSFGTKVLDISKKYIELRYSFIDYIYNLMYISGKNGLPVMRPMFLHYQNDAETYNISDQFMFGGDFIVAPVTKPKHDKRMVYLPEGNWYDYFSGEKYEGKKHFVKHAGLDELPMFVKEGAVILRNKPMQYVESKAADYEIHVYNPQPAEKEYYFDDGISFGYMDGAYSKIKVTVTEKSVKIDKTADKYGIGSFDIVIHSGSEKFEIRNIVFGKEYSNIM